MSPRVILLLLAGMIAASSAPAAGPTPAERLRDVRQFAYQLQNLDVDAAATSKAELLIIDPMTDAGRLSADQIAKLKRMPDGKSRLVVAYLSIGEAEDYRPYWRKAWTTAPPAWLGPENPDWKGNFKVRFWDEGWQRLMIGSPDASLDQILQEGYDGVYLDIIDAFEFWQDRGVPDARAKMIEWARKLSSYSKAKRAGFLVIPQNGETLAEDKDYLAAVDGIGREDLYYDGDRKQSGDEVRSAERDLRRFIDAGKPVFSVHYCRKPADIADVEARTAKQGYVSLNTVRDLDQLIVSPRR